VICIAFPPFRVDRKMVVGFAAFTNHLIYLQ